MRHMSTLRSLVLLKKSIRGLEKLSVIKHEQFDNYELVHLIKRLPGALPYFAVRDISESLKNHISHIVQDTTNKDLRIRFFDEWFQGV